MKSAEDPQSVEEALDRYWQIGSLPGHVPDYSGFYDWVTRRLDSIKRAVPLPLHSGASSRQSLPLEIAKAAIAAGIEITLDAATPDPKRFARWDGKQSKLKRLNKSKLLLSYLRDSSPRWREVLLTLSKADPAAISLPRTSSQSEHRAAFFLAVAQGDELAAFKMVGRLREESHHKGEVAFLEQTASFHSNRFEEAIRYAREVPNDAIDWPRSFMLLLESHAYLGDFGSIEPIPLEPEEGLLRPEHADALLSALDGTGVSVKAESNSVHRIGGGPLLIATEPSGISTHPDASCVDGLDPRQWKMLRELLQPGERLPLVLVWVEKATYRVMACGWISSQGLQVIRSFDELQALLNAWDGQEAPKGAWHAARQQLTAQAREQASKLAQRQEAIEATTRAAQVSAARFRLIEELGRTLICFEPDTDDLNGKFHRLASEKSATADRLQNVFAHLESYTAWDEFRIADLREYRATLTSSQVKTRLTGRELDAALNDPRWVMRQALSYSNPG